MKKIFTLIAGFTLLGTLASKGQDTLLYEGFQFDMSTYLTNTINPPPGVISDAMWYDYDADQLSDGSGSPTPRAGDWFQSRAYSDSNLYVPGHALDTNLVMASNSWFTPAGKADNWLITSNIQLGAHDTLFWKSAPRQTPRYCDGYQVLISITNNSDLSFNDTLFTAAEMTAIKGTNDSVFGGYQFSPGFVHGLDGTYTENQHDSARLIGILHPFKKPLDAYANKNIFIAFHHNSYDDNLISIDDILIRGTPAATTGIKENKADLGLSVFPNPSKDNARLNFNLSSEASVIIMVNDLTGKLVYSENKGSLAQGRHFACINTATLSKGFYTITIQTESGRNTAKLIVQ